VVVRISGGFAYLAVAWDDMTDDDAPPPAR